MTDNYLTVAVESLRGFGQSAFASVGMSAEDAATATDVLIRADLRGIETHGMVRLPVYVNRIRKELINPRARPHIVRETPTTLLVDGDRGLGLVVSTWTMDRCIAKAKEMGSAWAAVRHTSHAGAIGLYAMRALAHDMIGICMTAAGPRVRATYGTQRALGTNPLAVAIPSATEPPFMLDMATSVVAQGKIETAVMHGEPIPAGWALDPDGQPTTDPERGLAGDSLPLGSTPELASYKGYGLALMVDLFCQVLTGMESAPVRALARPLSHGQPVFVGDPATPLPATPFVPGHFFAALRVDAFRPAAEFKAGVDQTLHSLHAMPHDGNGPVRTPGDAEHRLEEERRRHGIPLHTQSLTWLHELAKELDIPCHLPGGS
ncbi:MAG: Ldh family oxidoreductase [Anaerolineae bacterium]|nr:Ldh family oxidoreductase [Anaerolineae bacterium]